MVSVWVLACEAAYVGPPRQSAAAGGGRSTTTSAIVDALGAAGNSPELALGGMPTATGGREGGSTGSTAGGLGSSGGAVDMAAGAAGASGLGASAGAVVVVAGTAGASGLGASAGAVVVAAGTAGASGSTGEIGGSTVGIGGGAGVGGTTTTALGGTDGGIAGASGSNSTVWPSLSPLGTGVPVCWSDNATVGKTAEGTGISPYLVATLQRWIREAVENTWGRFTELDFAPNGLDPTTHEWPRCTSGSPSATIRLDFTDDGDFGDRTYRSDAPTLVRIHTPRTDRTGYSLAAIKTFGQALGLLDKDHSGELTAMDVAFAQRLYGRKHSGATVAWGGRCLEPTNAPEVLEQSNPLVVNRCASVPWQRWRPIDTPPNGVQGFIISYSWAMYCATVRSDNTLVTGPCMQDVWALPPADANWRGWGGQCVTAIAAEPGATLSLQPCSNSPLQKWNLFSNYLAQIKLSDSDLCVTVNGNADTATVGTTLQLAGCKSDVPEQTFDLSIHDHLRFARGLCLQADASQSGNSIPLQLGSPCSEFALEQMFHVSGNLRAMNGGCLSLVDNLSFTNAAVVVLACQSIGRQVATLPEWQEWDYHW